MSRRRLVVTADDLGRDPVSTATVLGLLAEGHVTATTLLVVGPGAADAAAGAAALGVTPRLHATLTSEHDLPPWSPLSRRMLDGAAHLAADPHLLQDLTEEDVAAELTAQLAWMRGAGLHPGGADSHAGTLYGLTGTSWLELTLRWCAEHGLAFRLPRDLAPYLGAPPPGDLAARHREALALADALGVPLPATTLTNAGSAVELGSYETLRDRTIEMLDRLPEGTSELFLHPAEGLPGETGRTRAWEAQLLRDPAWRAALDAARIELVPDWWRNR